MDYEKASKEEQLKILDKPLEEIKEAYRGLAESIASKYGVDADIPLSAIERARKLYLKSKRNYEFKFSTYAAYFMKEACEKTKSENSAE
jgi:hypothetical protein